MATLLAIFIFIILWHVEREVKRFASPEEDRSGDTAEMAEVIAKPAKRRITRRV
jgi:hypothetical protein